MALECGGVFHGMDLASRNTARKLNAEGYKDILTRYVLSTVEDQFGDDDCLYQHDNAPCHEARSVRESFVDNKVPEMDCPAQNPDQIPTENLWDELER
jgi:hypothetical protein